MANTGPTMRHRSSHIGDRSPSEDEAELVHATHQAPPIKDGAMTSLPGEDTLLREVAHYAGLVLASMLGTLIRLGLIALATYDGMVVYPLLWAQGVGCGIMGLAAAKKAEINAIYPPLFTFLSTGIAGSVTTFSSWMLESYVSFSNFDDRSRSGLHDTVDGLAYSFSTYLIALGGIHIGTHFASLLPRFPPPHHPASASERTEKLKHRSRIYLVDILVITSAFICYLVILLVYFLGPRSWRHDVVFPLLLAPPGTMLRFALSKLNTLPNFADRFPIGTFIANEAATLVDAAVFALQHIPATFGSSVESSSIRCNALYALQQGFCGCLSTVSTFVVESRSIKRNSWKWLYVGSSVVLGHLFVLSILSGLRWSGHVYGAVCRA